MTNSFERSDENIIISFGKEELIPDLYGHFDKNLHRIESVLNVNLHGRGKNVSISGKDVNLAKDVLKKSGKYNYIDNQKVVLDSNIITSTGPAPAIDFALALVNDFLSAEDYDKLLDILQYKVW